MVRRCLLFFIPARGPCFEHSPSPLVKRVSYAPCRWCVRVCIAYIYMCILFGCRTRAVVAPAAPRIAHWKRATNIISLWKMIINYTFLLQSRAPSKILSTPGAHLRRVVLNVLRTCAQQGQDGRGRVQNEFFFLHLHIVLNAVTFSNTAVLHVFPLGIPFKTKCIYFRFFFFVARFTRLSRPLDRTRRRCFKTTTHPIGCDQENQQFEPFFFS